MSYAKKVSESLKNWKEELNLPLKCIMCGQSFKTQKELSKHQYYDCTGGW